MITFIREIVGVSYLMKGFTPALLSFLLVCNLNGESMTLKLKSGDHLGNCTYLEDANSYVYPNGKKKRKALFLCNCGDEFTSVIQDVKSGNTTSCGCYHKERVGNMSRKHELKKHKLYGIWANIKKRCYNESDPAYKNYGGRGITVCDEWRNDFKAFYDYVMALENAMQPGLTVDRMRNNEGYKPENLRWATRHIQATNQRIRKDNKSGFKGVSYSKANKGNKWLASIRVNGERKSLGHYHTIQESLNVRNQYIIDNSLTNYEIQPMI